MGLRGTERSPRSSHLEGRRDNCRLFMGQLNAIRGDSPGQDWFRGRHRSMMLSVLMIALWQVTHPSAMIVSLGPLQPMQVAWQLWQVPLLLNFESGHVSTQCFSSRTFLHS